MDARLHRLPQYRITMRPRALRSLTSTLASVALTALAGAGCGGSTPVASVPAQPPSAILTATPYARPPQPIIVDPSGAVSGGQPNFREVPYRVEAGDTLLGIALRFDTTVEAVMKRNNLTSSDLKIGQDLVIPTSVVVVATAVPASTPGVTATPAARTPTPTTAAPTSTPSGTATPVATPASGTPASGTPAPGTTTVINGVRYYIVEPGDTASGIANQFGVGTEALAQANGRTIAGMGNIQPGDRIIIPPAR